MAAVHFASLLVFAVITQRWTYGLFEDVHKEAKSADSAVQDLIDSVKEEFVRISHVDPGKFQALSYRMEPIYGTYYFIKVVTVEDQFCHLKIYKPLPQSGDERKLLGAQCDKTQDEPLQYF